MGGGQAVLFVVMGVAAAVSALYAVLTRQLLRSIMALGAFLTAVAVEFYVLSADFVSLVQIFVYVGGVVVLMLFALMLSASGERHPMAGADRAGLGAVLAYLVGGVLAVTALRADLPEPGAFPEQTVSYLGRALLAEQLFAFELMGVILLAALVTALVVVRKERQ
ncbi:MAG: NADH-quinone oxidoreductase subunit J [Thermoleophilia bacterium]|nr:NADH-quinone oxidoreductase subunit J [Thermoleophilia bacterium]